MTAVVVGLVGFGFYAANLDKARVSDFVISVYQGEERLGGTQVSFKDVLNQGKPVVLNFWAGDCPPCRFEMPAFQRVYEGHRDDVLFLGVDVGVFTGLGTRRSGLALLDELGVTYPAGAAQNDRSVVDYSVFSMPTTVFFDAQGKILRRAEGTITERQLNDAVSQILGEG